MIPVFMPDMYNLVWDGVGIIQRKSLDALLQW